ncbi:MAG: hypothetical protein ABI587_16320 [Gemmatimonadales bacterium]
MHIPPSNLLLAALLLVPSRSMEGQVVSPASAPLATERPGANAPGVSRSTEAADPRHDLGLMLVARTTLVGLAALGLLAYARRKQDAVGTPANDHGLRLAPVHGRESIAARMEPQPSRSALHATEDVAGSIRGDTVERRVRPAGRRMTATLDADLTDATGQVVIPVGTIVELTVTETIEPTKTPTGYGMLTLDVTSVRVLGHPDSSRIRRGTRPRLGQQGRMSPGETT